MPNITRNFDEQYSNYEERLCKYFRNCDDCPANARDNSYGYSYCGFDLVRKALDFYEQVLSEKR